MRPSRLYSKIGSQQQDARLGQWLFWQKWALSHPVKRTLSTDKKQKVWKNEHLFGLIRARSRFHGTFKETGVSFGRNDRPRGDEACHHITVSKRILTSLAWCHLQHENKTQLPVSKIQKACENRYTPATRESKCSAGQGGLNFPIPHMAPFRIIPCQSSGCWRWIRTAMAPPKDSPYKKNGTSWHSLWNIT